MARRRPRGRRGRWSRREATPAAMETRFDRTASASPMGSAIPGVPPARAGRQRTLRKDQPEASPHSNLIRKAMDTKIKQSDEKAGAGPTSASDAQGGNKVPSLSRHDNGELSILALVGSLVGSRLSPGTYSPHGIFFRVLLRKWDLNHTFFTSLLPVGLCSILLL